MGEEYGMTYILIIILSGGYYGFKAEEYTGTDARAECEAAVHIFEHETRHDAVCVPGQK